MANGELVTEWIPQLVADFRLHYQKGAARITKGDPQLGRYVGSGTGEAGGPLVSGKIRWDLFEAQSELLCAGNFRGEVKTKAGVMVEFECLGFLRRPEAGSRVWTMSGSVIFRSDDSNYKELTERPAVWEGEFDMSTYMHRYRIYRQRMARSNPDGQ
jgi:hypothetical protein